MTATKIPAAKLTEGNVFADRTTGERLTVAAPIEHDGSKITVTVTSATMQGTGQQIFKPAEVVTILPRTEALHDVAINPERTGSKTGYCTHRNHKKCPYRPGGKCENGIGMPNGGYYMCPCECHADQVAAVEAQRAAFSRADDAEVQADRLEANKARSPKLPESSADADAANRAEVQKIRGTGKARKSVVAQLVSENPGQPPAPKASGKQAQRAAAPAQATPKGKAGRPAKSTASVASKAGKVGLTTAEKRDVRVRMAKLLRESGEFTGADLAYLEAHWLRYIDPDLDKARREAAAAK